MTTADHSDWAFDGRRYRRHRFSPELQVRLGKLNKLDNWHAPLAYFRDVLIIATSILAPIYLSWWLYPLSVLLIASRQRAFSNLLHESAHGIAAANPRLNLMLGTGLTAYPIFQTHYGYKRSHVATHHPKLGSPSEDPDLRYFIEQGVYESGSRRQLLMRLVILPALGSTTASHVCFLIRDRILRRGSLQNQLEHNGHWLKRMRRDQTAIVIFWFVTTVLLLGTGSLFEFVIFWIVPYLTVFQVLGWYIELSEHTPLVKRSNVDLYMTRNRMSRGVELFLTGTYADHRHLDHHLDVRTPYWNLKEAHRIRLEDPDYARVHEGFGGLFTSSRQGARSAVSEIVEELYAMSEQRNQINAS